MKYSPPVISGLYCDNRDSEGVLFWYEFLISMNKE
jgi:hypothetical protein